MSLGIATFISLLGAMTETERTTQIEIMATVSSTPRIMEREDTVELYKN
jgi:hypothetical protein